MLEPHDHNLCRSEALDAAMALCERRGARLTPLRRRVLELVWRGHAAVGAYEILENLRGERGAVTPPTVYRALDFLIAHGLVHRLASLNAYIGCPAPQRRHVGQFMTCRTCHETVEATDDGPADAVAESARRADFSVERVAIEVQGQCAACRRAGEAHA